MAPIRGARGGGTEKMRMAWSPWDVAKRVPSKDAATCPPRAAVSAQPGVCDVYKEEEEEEGGGRARDRDGAADVRGQLACALRDHAVDDDVLLEEELRVPHRLGAVAALRVPAGLEPPHDLGHALARRRMHSPVDRVVLALHGDKGAVVLGEGPPPIVHSRKFLVVGC